MSSIEALASEELLVIFSCLGARDLCRVASTCKRWRRLAQDEMLWRNLSKRVCKVHINLESWPVTSFRELYKRVLHSYAWLLGLWRIEMKHGYGGLILVQILDGCIQAEQFVPPFGLNNNIIESPLTHKPMFRVQLRDDLTPAVQCLMQWSRHHQGQLIQTDASNQSFHFQCQDLSYHSMFYGNKRYQLVNAALMGHSEDPQIQEWIEKEIGWGGPDPPGDDLACNVKKLLSFSEDVLFKRVELQSDQSNFLFQPGVFKGTYGAHGIELIQISFVGDEIIGLKLSGDPNVPNGQISFRGDLTAPLKETCSRAVIAAQVQPTVHEEVAHARRADLEDAYHSVYMRNPDKSLARFKAQCHVAFTDFQNPSWIDGELAVFSRDVLGVLYRQIETMVVLQRTDEPYLQVECASTPATS